MASAGPLQAPDHSAVDPAGTLPQETGPGAATPAYHGSPYYFPVNAGTPLFQEIPAGDGAGEGTGDESGDETGDETGDGRTAEGMSGASVDDPAPKPAQYGSWHDGDDTVNLQLDKFAFTPGEPVRLYFTVYQNFTPVVNDVVRVNIYRGFYRYYNYWYSNYYSAQQVLVTQVTTNATGGATLTFAATSTPGLYSVMYYREVRGNTVASYGDFTVGQVGVFCRAPRYFRFNHTYRAAVQLVNLTGFRALPGTAVSYAVEHYDHTTGAWTAATTGTVLTDAAGHAVFEPVIQEPATGHARWYYGVRLHLNATVGAHAAEYLTYLYQAWDDYWYNRWDGEQAVSSSKYQFVVSTDKPIYTPGDTMHLRALVWEYDYLAETRAPLASEPVLVTVRDPDQLAVYWTTVQTDAAGVLQFTFPWDVDVAPGTYSLQFDYRGQVHAHDVPVDYYEKPAFRATIDTGGREFYPDAQRWFAGSVDVEYYFGQPVPGARVNLTLFDSQDAPRHTVTGTTDAQGAFHFRVDLARVGDVGYCFKARVSVEDDYGRSATTQKWYSRFEEIYTYGYLADWTPAPTDPVEYFVRAYQLFVKNDPSSPQRTYYYWNYEMNPLANVTVDVTVYGVQRSSVAGQFTWWPSSSDARVPVHGLQVYTDAFGAADLSFQLPAGTIARYDWFQVESRVVLDDGRSATETTYFRYQKYELTVDVGAAAVQPGSTVTFHAELRDVLDARFVVGCGRVYLYDANYQQVCRGTVEVHGNESFAVTLPTHAPAGRYWVYSYVWIENQAGAGSQGAYPGFFYHSDSTTFQVGASQALTLQTNASGSPTRWYWRETTVGSTLHVTVTSTVSTNLPHYIEVYKRGLVWNATFTPQPYAGSGTGGTGSPGGTYEFYLPVDAGLAPQFTIMTYVIGDTGRVHEATQMIDVTRPFNFTLVTDRAVYEPGDAVTLTITPTGPEELVTAISFVDSAVLAVQPEDDSEAAYFTQPEYWCLVSSGSSWGSGIDYWFYWWAIPTARAAGDVSATYGGAAPEGPPGGQDLVAYDESTNADGGRSTGASPPSFESLSQDFQTAVRENISESANWIPVLRLAGPRQLTFTLPDNIGAWTIRVVGTTASGQGLIKTIEIQSFLPFFVEFEVPGPVRQDDIIAVQAYVYNYLPGLATTSVAISAPGFEVLNNPVQSVGVPSALVTQVEFSLLCTTAGRHNLSILAATTLAGTPHSDAKQLEVYVHPNGLEFQNLTTGFLNASTGQRVLAYNLSADAVYHAESLAVYADLMDASLTGWQALVGYPYGCVEQTTAKLVATALVHDYLDQTGQLTASVADELTGMVMAGLSRLYAMQGTDGGWGWWRGESRVQMTAIVLTGLNTVAESGFAVNPTALTRAVQYLTARRHADGAWRFSYAGVTALEATAFVTRALATTPAASLTPAAVTVRDAAMAFLEDAWYAPAWQGQTSPYVAGLFLTGTRAVASRNATFVAELLASLVETKRTQGASEVYWSADLPGYGGSLGGNVETTALAATALAGADFVGHYALLKGATEFILARQDQWGWYGTADSLAAIQALTTIKARSTATELIAFTGTLNVSCNGATPAQFSLDLTGSARVPGDVVLALDPYLRAGANAINLTLVGTGGIYYRLQSTQVVRADPVVNTPADYHVRPGAIFNLSVRFRGVSTQAPLFDVELALEGPTHGFATPAGTTTGQVSAVLGNGTVTWTLQAPDHPGTYTIDGISLAATIAPPWQGANGTIWRLFRRTIGPVTIRVGENAPTASTPPTASIANTAPGGQGILVASARSGPSPAQGAATLQISKSVAAPPVLTPGDAVAVTLTISNPGPARDYYAVDDAIPTGTSLVGGSVQVSPATGTTVTTTGTRLSVFFDALPSGTTTVTYRLQVEHVRNSNWGECRLWGMYDGVEVHAAPGYLETLPVRFHANATVFADATPPALSGLEVSQSAELDATSLGVRFEVTDQSPLARVRCVFHHAGAWHAYQFLVHGGETGASASTGESIVAFDRDVGPLADVAGEVQVFVEVVDAYGNVATSALSWFHVLPPSARYASVGILVGVAVGLAGLAALLTRRRGRGGRRSDDSRPMGAVERDAWHLAPEPEPEKSTPAPAPGGTAGTEATDSAGGSRSDPEPGP